MSKRKTIKRKISKRKTNRKNASKRKTNKRKSNRRKSNKRSRGGTKPPEVSTTPTPLTPPPPPRDSTVNTIADMAKNANSGNVNGAIDNLANIVSNQQNQNIALKGLTSGVAVGRQAIRDNPQIIKKASDVAAQLLKNDYGVDLNGRPPKPQRLNERSASMSSFNKERSEGVGEEQLQPEAGEYMFSCKQVKK